MKSTLLVVMTALLLGACVQTGAGPGTNLFAAGGGLAERPIDGERWTMRSGMVQRPDGTVQRMTLHVCPRTACRSPAFVAVSYTPARGAMPDRATLEHIATEQMPGRNEMNELVAAARGDGAVNRILVSEVATFKGRPGIAVEIERRRNGGARSIYQVGGFAFTGNMMISVQSFSTDRSFARRNRDQVLDGINVGRGL
ncbi:hypothetical protein BN1110_04028 [bacterium YEK0313]|nr:hypothetical protein BN1110_04028 [bacterium YEK0313]